MKSSTVAGTQEWHLGVTALACSAEAFGFLEAAVYHEQ